MTQDLTKEKLEEYQSAFNFFDANNDGYITIEELEGAMNKCDQFPTKLELKLLMKQADKDQNGVITIDEFVDFMNTPKRCQYSSEELLEQFRLFDKDKDGFITREEMISIVAEFGLGGDFPRDVIDTLFQEADTDGDGMINLDEFVVAMK